MNELADFARQKPGGAQHLELRRAAVGQTTVVEATFGVVWSAAEECESQFLQGDMLGLMRAGVFVSVPCRDCLWHWLQGVISEDGRPAAIVVMDQSAKLHLLKPADSPWQTLDLPPVRTVWLSEGELSRKLVTACDSF